MTFTIFRTSDYRGEKPPCSMAQFQEEKDNGTWVQKVYTIEIDTLADLMNLKEEVGEIIIKDRQTIEIYDDYRE